MCGKNTLVVIDASGYGACAACGDGTHNPDPAKYRQCVCKIGHQPRNSHEKGGNKDGMKKIALSCDPCPLGHFKLQSANGMGAL